MILAYQFIIVGANEGEFPVDRPCWSLGRDLLGHVEETMVFAIHHSARTPRSLSKSYVCREEPRLLHAVY